MGVLPALPGPPLPPQERPGLQAQGSLPGCRRTRAFFRTEVLCPGWGGAGGWAFRVCCLRLPPGSGWCGSRNTAWAHHPDVRAPRAALGETGACPRRPCPGPPALTLWSTSAPWLRAGRRVTRGGLWSVLLPSARWLLAHGGCSEDLGQNPTVAGRPRVSLCGASTTQGFLAAAPA